MSYINKWGNKTAERVSKDLYRLKSGERYHYRACDLSNNDYHAVRNTVSSSMLKDVANRKVSDYYVRQKHVKKELDSGTSAALILGSATHAAVLEPELFDKEYIADGNINRRTKAGKEEYQALVDANPGATVLKQTEYDHVLQLRDAVHANSAARNLLSGGKAESSVFMKDAQTGLKLKARADYLIPGECVIDLKTALDCSPAAFQYDFLKLGYDIQQAHYQSVFDVPEMAYLVVGKNAPFEVAIYMINPVSLGAARNRWRDALNHFAECKHNNQWDSFTTSDNPIIEFDLPDWYLTQNGAA